MMPTDFEQINSTHVVILDSGSYRIRVVNRVTNSTSLLAGVCGVNNLGFKDGTFEEAKFGSLMSITQLPTSKGQRLLIIESDNQKVRHFDLTTRMLSTLNTKFYGYLQSLAIQPSTDVKFFSINQAIGWIDNSAVNWPEYLTLSFNDGLLPEVLFSEYTNN